MKRKRRETAQERCELEAALAHTESLRAEARTAESANADLAEHMEDVAKSLYHALADAATNSYHQEVLRFAREAGVCVTAGEHFDARSRQTQLESALGEALDLYRRDVQGHRDGRIAEIGKLLEGK